MRLAAEEDGKHGGAAMDVDVRAIGSKFTRRATPHPALRATPGSSPGGRLFPSKLGKGARTAIFPFAQHAP